MSRRAIFRVLTSTTLQSHLCPLGLQFLDLGDLVRGQDLGVDLGNAGLPSDGHGRLLVVACQEDDVHAHLVEGVDREVRLSLNRVRDAKHCHKDACNKGGIRIIVSTVLRVEGEKTNYSAIKAHFGLVPWYRLDTFVSSSKFFSKRIKINVFIIFTSSLSRIASGGRLGEKKVYEYAVLGRMRCRFRRIHVNMTVKYRASKEAFFVSSKCKWLWFQSEGFF